MSTELQRLAERFDELARQAPRMTASANSLNEKIIYQLRPDDFAGTQTRRTFQRLASEAVRALELKPDHHPTTRWLAHLFDAGAEYSETWHISETSRGYVVIREIQNPAEVSAVVLRRSLPDDAPDADDEPLRVQRCAQIAEVNRSTIYKWMDAGLRYHEVKTGGRRIMKADLMRWMTDHKRW